MTMNQIGITQIKMINYEYLSYWQKAMKDLELSESLLQTNINNYLQFKNPTELEYALENIKEIQRLIPLKIEFYDKIFARISADHREMKRRRRD